jgi:hypothetical protein
VESQPSLIGIKVFENQLKHLSPYTIQMMSNRNLTNVTVSLSDLRSDEIGEAWIPEKALVVSPNPLNLTAGKFAIDGSTLIGSSFGFRCYTIAN